MPSKKRCCPCLPCEEGGGDKQHCREVIRHLGEIQAGKRHRANPVHANGAQANPDSDDEEHGEAGGGVDLVTWATPVEWKEGDDDPDDDYPWAVSMPSKSRISLGEAL
jgi:hypothetical protein